MTRFATLLSIAALAVSPFVAAAQATPTAAARDTAADRRAALAIVKGLFDAMRTGDSAAARALFHPRAQLATVGMRTGEPTLAFESVDELARAFGSPRTEILDERTYDEVVHLDGPLAVVWTQYSLYVGSRFSHCGVDVFQLAQTKEGWRIIALADTRRRTGCRDAPAR